MQTSQLNHNLVQHPLFQVERLYVWYLEFLLFSDTIDLQSLYKIVSTCHVVQRGCGISILGNTQKPNGSESRQPTLHNLVWTQCLTRRPPKVTFSSSGVVHLYKCILTSWEQLDWKFSMELKVNLSTKKLLDIPATVQKLQRITWKVHGQITSRG